MQEIQNAYDDLERARTKLLSLKAPAYEGPFAQQAKRRFFVEHIEPAMKEVDRLEDVFTKLCNESNYDDLFREYADITRRWG